MTEESRMAKVQKIMKLLGYNSEFSVVDRNQIREWLATLELSPGFRDYIKDRDLIILKTLGEEAQSEKMRLILIGQRMELKYLAGSVREEMAKRERESKKLDTQIHKDNKKQKIFSKI